MGPGVFERGQLSYVEKSLRILSGLYGLLRPFDGVVPYRLEMQSKLSIEGSGNLYSFWGDKLAKALCAETSLLLNLASKEYSRAVLRYLPPEVRLLTCSFGELCQGKVVEKGTLCKMARGEMVRFLAEHGVSDPEEIKEFRGLGYAFSPDYSTKTQYTFIKGEKARRQGGRGSGAIDLSH